MCFFEILSKWHWFGQWSKVLYLITYKAGISVPSKPEARRGIKYDPPKKKRKKKTLKFYIRPERVIRWQRQVFEDML